MDIDPKVMMLTAVILSGFTALALVVLSAKTFKDISKIVDDTQFMRNELSGVGKHKSILKPRTRFREPHSSGVELRDICRNSS